MVSGSVVFFFWLPPIRSNLQQQLITYLNWTELWLIGPLSLSFFSFSFNQFVTSRLLWNCAGALPSWCQSFLLLGNPASLHRPQGVLQGPEEELRQREEEGRTGATVDLQGPVHHRSGRLAQGPRNPQELDEAVVRPQAGTPSHLPESESEGEEADGENWSVLFSAGASLCAARKVVSDLRYPDIQMLREK